MLDDVRVGMGASMAKIVWERVVRPWVSLINIRDAAMIFFTFLFGLRESIIQTIKKVDVWVLTARICEILVTKLEGRTTEEVIRRGPRVCRVPLFSGTD